MTRPHLNRTSAGTAIRSAQRVTIVVKTNQGARWLIPQIIGLQSRGAVISAVLPRGVGSLTTALQQIPNIAVHEVAFDFRFKPSISLAKGLLELRKKIIETNPDVLFYHLYASALASRFGSLGLNTRKVHMVAGPLYLENRWIRLAERVLHRLDSTIIAGSDYTARQYQAIGRRCDRMETIPYGVDTETFHPVTDQRELLFNASPSCFVIIQVSYVYAPRQATFSGKGIKGHELLISAYRQFAKDHPDSLLVFVGSGFDQAGEQYRQMLQSEAATVPDGRILWFDTVEDVRPYYSSSDISVSPSLSENHGAALEAGAMALPRIVSDAGGLPETTSDETGWVVRAGDVEQLLRAMVEAHHAHEAGGLKRMGSQARQFIHRQYNVTSSVSRVTKVVLG